MSKKLIRKSLLVSFFLTLLFGPLGLLYSSIAAGIGMTLISFFVLPATAFIAMIVIWPLCILVGLYTTGKYNREVALEEVRHRELLDAAKTGGLSRLPDSSDE